MSGNGRGTLGWWIAVLFMIGSSCFALGAFPPFVAVVSVKAVGVVFFVGSLFFTSAGYSQFVQSCNEGRSGRIRLVAWQPRNVDWWASGIQLVGTLWFNINTFEAMLEGFTVVQQDFRIWTPDFLGSICFLLASALAIFSVSGRLLSFHRHDTNLWIANINMLGSVFFMFSAAAAFVRPKTSDLLDASIANSGTFLGAVCFFWAAELLRRTVVHPERTQPAFTAGS